VALQVDKPELLQEISLGQSPEGKAPELVPEASGLDSRAADLARTGRAHFRAAVHRAGRLILLPLVP